MITMNRKWMRLMVLVGCAALAASCKQAPAAQTEAEYAVLRVSPSDKVLSTTYSATIRGRQDIDIYPQVSGFLTQLCVEEGQAVRKGQVLFILIRCLIRQLWKPLSPMWNRLKPVLPQPN